MIIGKGDIAQALIDREGFIFFASGVSNSSETKAEAFKREQDLLLAQDKTKCLVYFSTISQYYQVSEYIFHKRKIERLIKDNWASYCILKIGNITWGSNPNTFLNKMMADKKAGIELQIRDEYKYMLSKKDLLAVTRTLPNDQKFEICLFSFMGKVKEIINFVSS